MVVADERWPGDFLLHPVAVGSVAVLILNDWLIKERWPGAIAGKLSDIAGLIFFPLLLVALMEFGARLGRSTWLATGRTFATVAAVVALVFVATKTISPVRDADEVVLGWLWWTPRALFQLVQGEPAGSPGRHQVVADLTDLLAVPSVLAAVWIGRSYRTPVASTPSTTTQVDA